MSLGEWHLITLSNGLYSLISPVVLLNSYNCFNFFVSLKQIVWTKGNFLFNCTVFCPVRFSFVVVLSDSLTFICEETSNIVSLFIPSEVFQECALSDLCLLWFRKPPFTLFAVCRTGFLTYSCAVKDAVFGSGLTESLFLNQMKIKRNF